MNLFKTHRILNLVTVLLTLFFGVVILKKFKKSMSRNLRRVDADDK
jgi:hypothetical protein